MNRPVVIEETPPHGKEKFGRREREKERRMRAGRHSHTLRTLAVAHNRRTSALTTTHNSVIMNEATMSMSGRVRVRARGDATRTKSRDSEIARKLRDCDTSATDFCDHARAHRLSSAVTVPARKILSRSLPPPRSATAPAPCRSAPSRTTARGARSTTRTIPRFSPIAIDAASEPGCLTMRVDARRDVDDDGDENA